MLGMAQIQNETASENLLYSANESNKGLNYEDFD